MQLFTFLFYGGKIVIDSIIIEVLNKLSNKNDIAELKKVLYCVLSKYEITERKYDLETIEDSWKK